MTAGQRHYTWTAGPMSRPEHQAEAPYELSGLTPNVVFPTGLLLQGDELWMYYSAVDSCTCLATAKLDEVLALLVD